MDANASDPARTAPAAAEPATWEPFDADFAREILETRFRPIMSRWFRPRILGAEKLPRSGPLVLAANHSGNAFPYDAMVLDAVLWQRDGYDPAAKFRSVFDKELAWVWWMRPFGIDNFWRRCGGVDATFDNFDRLLARGDRVIYYPEGVPGIGKGFFRRYQLQPFRTSFVTVASRNRAPVYPCYILNAEWVLPFSFTIKSLDALVHRLFHVPFLPLPAAPLGLAFPWAWYMALPVRLIFVIGDPIDVRAMAEAEGVTDFDRPPRDALLRVAERVRVIMQGQLSRYVERYGRWPYQARSLRRRLRDARRRRILHRVLPTAWCGAFVRYERDQRRPPARSRMHALLRDWDLLGFYLPFGWPLLSLARRWRKPPHGYRGLTSEERDRREGNFTWRLAERPLPPRD